MTVRKPWFDAGHGGQDPGAVGVVNEDDGNLAIVLKCIAAAKRQGWTPGATRTEDRFVTLSDRCLLANTAGASAFVSVHADWIGAKGAGFQAIHHPGSVPGLRLSDTIFDELDWLTAYEDVGVYADRRGLAVLRGTEMPATIIEVLSVAEAILKDPVFQTKVAEEIVQGLCRWYGDAYVPPGKTTPTPTSPSAPKPVVPKFAGPKWPGRNLRLRSPRRGPYMTGSDVRTWQARMKARGWTITVDGVFGPQSDRVCRAFQAEKHLLVDGVVGLHTWSTAWTARVT